MGELIGKNDPLLSWNGVDVQCKLQPTNADVATLGSDFQAAWNKEFKNNPDKPVMILSIVSCFPGDPSGVPAGQYMGTATFSTHTFSRGRIHVTGPKFTDPYEFDAGFLADENGIDAKKHFWMYKKQREIIRRMENFAGEVAAGHPEFPKGSKAAVIDQKPASEVQDIEYTPEDDQAIAKFLKERISTTWHSMSTCKMALFKDGGVVNNRLSVYEVKGLKVADLSIPPSNPTWDPTRAAWRWLLEKRLQTLLYRNLDLENKQQRLGNSAVPQPSGQFNVYIHFLCPMILFGIINFSPNTRTLGRW